LKRLISEGQKNGEILRLLGWCYHKTNRDEDAIRTFREAVELNPTDERNFLDLGGYCWSRENSQRRWNWRIDP